MAADDSSEEEYELLIGHLDPLEENSGVVKRLDNLGFIIGSSKKEEENLKFALTNFQRENKLNQTADADQMTKDKLKHRHGS